MMDELEELRAALGAATPRPDPAVRAAHLRAAAEAFTKNTAAGQGSAAAPRPSSASRPVVGPLRKGLDAMIRTLNPLKAGLVATTALVAVGIVAFVPETRSLLTPPGGGRGDTIETPLPAPQPPAPQERAEVGPAPGTEAPPLAGGAAAPPPPAGDRGRSPVGEPAPADAAPLVEKDAPPAPAGSPAPGHDAAGRMAAADEAAPKTAAPAPLPGLAAPPPPSYLPEAAAAPADRLAPPEPDTEAFANADPNPVKVVAEEPVSTFSIDVDTASWGVVRASLMAGSLPPPDAVRVEEMINYFPYHYPAPAADAAFRPTITVMDTPWNAGTKLVHIGLQGAMPAVEDRPPLNLVFLIDTSGSMDDPAKLPLLVQSFRLMLDELRPEDRVAIVTYAGSAGLVLEPTPASDRARIVAALANLQAGGSTAGQAGLQQAYSVAAGMAGEGRIGRIILATDGDFNVGISDPEALEDYVAKQRESGIYLSVLGFGRGNLDDATMQALAQNGNGTAAYIDTLNEAHKVLVDELTGALFPIADDVKIQVEFNPATVAEYRLIGYETRALRREDFNNDRVDAGEIGAGVQVTAIYEVTPVGSPAVRNDDLRYAAAPAAEGSHGDELGFLRLRYKAPGEDVSKLIEMPIPAAADPGGDDQRFAAAIAGFGQLLRGSDYLGDWGYAQAIALAGGARGEDPFGYRAEAVRLMRLAESLARR